MDADTLSFAAYIGCGIAIICLLLTIFILFVLGYVVVDIMSIAVKICLLRRIKVFDQIQDFVHFNITLALLVGLFMFVFGVEVAKDNDVRTNLKLMYFKRMSNFIHFRWPVQYWEYSFTMPLQLHSAGHFVKEFWSMFTSIIPSMMDSFEHGNFS